MKRVFVIAGPTASGKSHLAIQLAQRVGGEIINADSLQVYRDVPLLTARPTTEDEKIVPHHLYGYMDATQRENCHDWLQRAVAEAKQIDTPIFVGGTGLYLKALTQGLSKLPPIPDAIRTQVRQMPIEEVRVHLPADCPTDPQRARRALEVFFASGHWPSYFYAQAVNPLLDVNFYTILVNPPREKLYERINTRFHQMIEQGALDEVEDLLKANPKKSGGVFQALGVKELIAVIEKTSTIDEACTLATQATRHYAKRQITWFRHQMSFTKTIEKAEISALSNI